MKPEQPVLELSSEDRAIYESDLMDLRAAEGQHKINLESRVKFGLDPASMMVVRDVTPLVERVARELGTDPEKVWPLIDELHKKGPWRLADRLSSVLEPEIRVYLVLASACHEKIGRDLYTPQEYLSDRRRVIEELNTFTFELLAERRQNIIERVRNRTDETREVDGRRITVPVAEGDPALALALQGFKGCVTRGGEVYYAQTAVIDDSLLEHAGLVRGFAEIYDAAEQGFKRVGLEEAPAYARIVWVLKEEDGKDLQTMRPAAKRIGEGYILTYTNKDLAVDLVARAVA